MTTQEAILEINEILEGEIDYKKDDIVKEDSAKIESDYGQCDYYLDKIEGSYHMSLQNLIHHIMYAEDIYDKILKDEKDFIDALSVIVNTPDSIYYPEDNEELQNKLDEIYCGCIKFVGQKLYEIGFNTQDTFKDYL